MVCSQEEDFRCWYTARSRATQLLDLSHRTSGEKQLEYYLKWSSIMVSWLFISIPHHNILPCQGSQGKPWQAAIIYDSSFVGLDRIHLRSYGQISVAKYKILNIIQYSAWKKGIFFYVRQLSYISYILIIQMYTQTFECEKNYSSMFTDKKNY